ncbi:MAG: DUF86 domain-containing protein [Phycisphaerae bacterium]
MQPESAKLLQDILDAANRIAGYVSGKSRDDFLARGELHDAVHWNFAIVGEAMSQLHKIDPLCAERISEWRRIIGFRNQLIHGYGVIKSDITWDIIQTRLQKLREEVQAILG